MILIQDMRSEQPWQGASGGGVAGESVTVAAMGY